jgi:hypothetical protein
VEEVEKRVGEVGEDATCREGHDQGEATAPVSELSSRERSERPKGGWGWRCQDGAPVETPDLMAPFHYARGKE